VLKAVTSEGVIYWQEAWRYGSVLETWQNFWYVSISI